MNYIWKISRWIYIFYFMISVFVDTKENTRVKGLLGTNGFPSTSPKSSLLPSSSSGHSQANFHSSSDPNKILGFGRKPSKLVDDGFWLGGGNNLHFCEGSHEEVECSDLNGNCLQCNFDAVKDVCIYGKNVSVKCNVTESIPCKGKRHFERNIVCQYCYQTPTWQQICHGGSMCNSIGAPRQYFKANCTVLPEVLCLGNRRFIRMVPCNWKNGYRWSTTFLLSITLGGFGADRFYLGRWQEGIGKLFSFGGLGLWTIVDIILIGVRYLGPADGSLYVD